MVVKTLLGKIGIGQRNTTLSAVATHPEYTAVAHDLDDVAGVFEHTQTSKYLFITDDGDVITTIPGSNECSCDQDTHRVDLTGGDHFCDHLGMFEQDTDDDGCRNCGSNKIVTDKIERVAITAEENKCAVCGNPRPTQ